MQRGTAHPICHNDRAHEAKRINPRALVRMAALSMRIAHRQRGNSDIPYHGELLKLKQTIRRDASRAGVAHGIDHRYSRLHRRAGLALLS